MLSLSCARSGIRHRKVIMSVVAISFMLSGHLRIRRSGGISVYFILFDKNIPIYAYRIRICISTDLFFKFFKFVDEEIWIIYNLAIRKRKDFGSTGQYESNIYISVRLLLRGCGVCTRHRHNAEQHYADYNKYLFHDWLM